ncbi:MULTISPECIES: hypothetical protein [unclassified Bradyrhizobium]|uniref:hypothetical protein n=1 Tax=unclassified Bradyrhizobium TaxID=2631580 RepID=UPI0028E85DD0|nr:MULTISPECIES: hypothetical protein [unclassified Bradyrhizobium]
MKMSELDLSEERWTSLHGGYRVPYDPRLALQRLERGDASAWDELWNELHHQGDIGEASFAAVPGLVRIHERRSVADWQTYAIIATIELARDDARNPAMPADLRESYDAAWRRLVDIGLRELTSANDAALIDSIIGVIAIARGQRALGRIAADFTEDERRTMLDGEWPP